jgi:hypothetical protein
MSGYPISHGDGSPSTMDDGPGLYPSDGAGYPLVAVLPTGARGMLAGITHRDM